MFAVFWIASVLISSRKARRSESQKKLRDKVSAGAFVTGAIRSIPCSPGRGGGALGSGCSSISRDANVDRVADRELDLHCLCGARARLRVPAEHRAVGARHHDTSRDALALQD